MASTYSTSLRLELMATGDQSGTWGTTTNTNLGTLLEQAITGVLSVAEGDTTLTLTAVNGGTDQSRNAVVNLTGALTAGRNVVVPTANKLYLIKNSTTGGFAVTVKTAAGTGVTVPATTARWVYCDGTNVVDGISGPWTPSADDAQALGLSGTAWSDLFLASGGVINWNAGNATLTHSAGLLTSNVTIASSGSSVGYTGFQAISTEAAAAAGPIIELYRNSASPAANDITGQTIFYGQDSAANKQEYASIQAVIADATSTSEDSTLDSYVQVAGTRTLMQSLGYNGVPIALNVPINLGFTATVSGNALTIALKGADGNDPSAGNPVFVPFRNATVTTGTPSYLAITTALSLVISSGSTMGFTSAVLGKLWWGIFNDGGTARIGAVNVLSGTSIMALADGIYSSTAEGGAGGADSAQVIYTGTAVTSKAFCICGALEATEATAGTWATAPSLVQIRTPTTPLPGSMVQSVRTDTGAVATGTTSIPLDDTAPQNTEGDQYMTQTITPYSGTSVLRIIAQGVFSHTVATEIMSLGLFQDTTASALTVASGTLSTATAPSAIPLNKLVRATSTSATTMKIRAGGNGAGTTTFNGIGGSREYAGLFNSFIQIDELVA